MAPVTPDVHTVPSAETEVQVSCHTDVMAAPQQQGSQGQNHNRNQSHNPPHATHHQQLHVEEQDQDHTQNQNLPPPFFRGLSTGSGVEADDELSDTASSCLYRGDSDTDSDTDSETMSPHRASSAAAPVQVRYPGEDTRREYYPQACIVKYGLSYDSDCFAR